MKNVLTLLLFFNYIFFNGQSTKNDFIADYANPACKCIEKIEVGNKTKVETNIEISECIKNQVSMYQLVSKLSDVKNLIDISESENSIENDSIKKEYNISIDPNEQSNDYKAYYYELERYLMDNCEKIKDIVASDNQESPVSVSRKKLALKYYDQGIIQFQKENFKKSIVLFKKAVKEDPNFAFAWDNLGLAYRKEGSYQKAISAYEKSLEIDPYGTMPLQNIAVAYQFENEFEKAIDTYKRLGEIYKSNPEVYFGIGKIYAVNLKDYEKGLDNMCKAYNIYVETSSPYRTDAEKIISFISLEMEKSGEEEKFKEILLENKINIQE